MCIFTEYHNRVGPAIDAIFAAWDLDTLPENWRLAIEWDLERGQYASAKTLFMDYMARQLNCPDVIARHPRYL